MRIRIKPAHVCPERCPGLHCLTAPTEDAPDVVASASVDDFYADGILEGDDLMNAIDACSGFYAVASVNPDGAPNRGLSI